MYGIIKSVPSDFIPFILASFSVVLKIHALNFLQKLHSLYGRYKKALVDYVNFSTIDMGYQSSPIKMTSCIRSTTECSGYFEYIFGTPIRNKTRIFVFIPQLVYLIFVRDITT